MNPILQFGTSRFLQAHVDLFVGEALERGEALGAITVVQSTANAESAARIAAFNRPGGYPVRIRGRSGGKSVEVEQRVAAITCALQASRHWPEIRRQVATTVQVIVSNTGDMGYALEPEDHAGLLESDEAPRSFPAKLLVLLHTRYQCGAAPMTLFPCELVTDNGRVLRDTVVTLARAWSCPPAFIDWLGSGCIWVNSLVDRIVSEPILPAGAVAEPYALWAIEAQPGMVLPCTHPQIVVTDRLEPYSRRKLFILNLGHTWLADQWRREQRPAGETVQQAMSDRELRQRLDSVWEDEVLPVFRALGDEAAARAYVAEVRDRFDNPFLAHRLADIQQNHEQKIERRIQPVVTMALELGLDIAQPQLRATLGQPGPAAATAPVGQSSWQNRWRRQP